MRVDSFGYPDREWTPPVICSVLNFEDLSFDPIAKRVDGSASDKQSPDYIHYQIEWREQIKEDASNILQQKKACSRQVRLYDTDIVLLMNSQRGILKQPC
ncbi:hypothetical protein N7495_001151 [Penicillium taxi]|uniref:uncharacterized protein n=1 Tax=Penicillium taxi TaxID=168475 RepID=UPI002545AD94|nr:uncharacterized protein N7495_001151 [Penicillium taxi]KAJ5908469.1 hypothetical protein N7495_001151 [Penicillium taxi]